MKKTANYIDNATFVKALEDYKAACAEAKEAGREDPPIPNYIGECFMKIAENLARMPRFGKYPHREEMIGDAIENCLMYFRNYDSSISKNAFSYFTQISWFAFIRRIQKEKTELYVKYMSTMQSGILDENEMLENEDGTSRQFEMYDNISEFIKNFEEAKEKKKAKKKPVVKEPKGIENFLED